jgi:hypothetical protein
MPLLMYVIGGVSIATGALVAGRSVHSLAKPGAGRDGRNNFVSAVGLLLVGTLLVLGVNDRAASRLGAVAVTALLLWQLGSMLRSHVQRRSPS